MNFREPRAIYLQIADFLCEAILKGKWQSEERIPSVRELAVSMEVNPNTAMRTYSYLQEKEIIYNKRGIGYFISTDGKQKVLTLKKQAYITTEIPRLIKTIKLLNISKEELISYFNKF